MCTGSGRCLIIAMLMASDERLVQRRVITHTPRLRRSSPERLGQPHLAHPTGTLAFGEAPSPGPTRRREAPSACSHWEAAPLPCARHFLWGTFLCHKNLDFSDISHWTTREYNLEGLYGGLHFYLALLLLSA